MRNPNYKYSGSIGTTANYGEYKKLIEDRIEQNIQKMLMLQEDEKDWYKKRARLWAKGRKAVRDNIKALKERLEAKDEPIDLAAFNPGKTYNEMYKNKAGDPDYYDVTTDVQEMR